MTIISDEYLKTLIHKRPAASHKGNFGKVMIIAGSKGMAGAAVFTGSAAVRAGAGLTRYYVPDEIIPILQVAVPEAMCIERTGDFSGLSELSLYDSIAIGPGLGKNPDNYRIIEKVLATFDGPVVIDADGLNAIVSNGDLDVIKNAKSTVIITPHPGEAAKLLETTVPEIEADREASVRTLNEKTGAICLLKGHETLISDGRDEIAVNISGTAGMAKGGSGDVLTGIIAAFTAQGMDPFNATMGGAYIHGRAGRLAEEKFGQYGMTASDMVKEIGLAIRELAGK